MFQIWPHSESRRQVVGKQPGCHKRAVRGRCCILSFVAHLGLLDRDGRCALPRGLRLRVNDELSCRHAVTACADLGSAGRRCQHGNAVGLLLSMPANVVSGSLIRRVAGGGQLGCSLYVFSNGVQRSDVESARVNSGGLPRSLSTESKAVLVLASVASSLMALSAAHRRRGCKSVAVRAPHCV